MSEKRKNIANIETQLKALSVIVELLEKGELSLEDSLKKFEEGIALTQQCQNTLEAAEAKLQQLTVAK